MRAVIILGALLLFGPAFAAPPSSTSLDARGVVIERSDTLPRRAYGWTTWLVGDDDVQVVITESDRTDQPALYQAYDNRGRPLWSATHTCPNFNDFATMFVLDDGRGKDPRVVCKIRKEVVGVDLRTGAEAWRFADPRPMYITAGAQGRVAVSIANEQLAVLASKDGREITRIDVDGAVLEAVAPTRAGPMAMLVWDTPSRPKDTIELPVGDGGALEKIELSGDDPGRKLVALPIGPRARGDKGAIAPMKPRWKVPFEGYSFEIDPSASVVVGNPVQGVLKGWDAMTGQVLWEHEEREGELIFFGDDGIGFARRGDGDRFVFGAMDARTLEVRWDKTLPAGERPLAGGQGGGDLGVITSGGFTLVRFDDGAERYSMPIPPGLELANIRSTPSSLIWVMQKDTERWVHFTALPKL